MADAQAVGLRFPLQQGDLAGCESTFLLTASPQGAADFTRRVAPRAPEPCEAGCGAFVGPSPVSGDVAEFDGPLRSMVLPSGMWEAPTVEILDDDDAVGDDEDFEDGPRSAEMVVFHSVDRCRELRGLEPTS